MSDKETTGPKSASEELIAGLFDRGLMADFEPRMLLRDYFAAAAMQGILGNRPNGFLVDVGTDNIAPWAYQIADAMLAEREKGKE